MLTLPKDFAIEMCSIRRTITTEGKSDAKAEIISVVMWGTRASWKPITALVTLHERGGYNIYLEGHVLIC